jgi:hypothetical protein
MEVTTPAEELWRHLSPLFAEDDGSLPEIRLTNLTAWEAAAIYEELRARAHPLRSDQVAWHEPRNENVQLAELPNAGLLAARAELNLHVVLTGISSHGVVVPDLGVSVWPGEVALDYRMGDDWNAVSVAAFVDLLSDLFPLSEGLVLEPAPEVHSFDERTRDEFRRAVAQYLARTAGTHALN